MKGNLTAMYTVILSFKEPVFNGQDWTNHQTVSVIANEETILQSFDDKPEFDFQLVLTDVVGNIYAYPSTNVLGIVFIKVLQ